MTKKLKCIMLIDDNDDDNFFHQRSIRKIDAAEKIIVMQTADAALEYLKKQPPFNLPDLIFLDINMPGVNGWEFIEQYKTIFALSNTVVIMLSTSQNPDDQAKAKSEPIIRDFKTKPLTVNTLENILEHYF